MVTCGKDAIGEFIFFRDWTLDTPLQLKRDKRSEIEAKYDE